MPHTSTLFDLLWGKLSKRQTNILTEIVLALAGAFVLFLSAQVAFPLPGNPVPVTMQTLVLFQLALIFGAKRSAIMALTYVLQGAAGLPVFEGGGFGLLRLFGPTGGYLIAFPVCAYLLGLAAERGFDRRPSLALISLILVHIVLFGLGSTWLSFYVGAESAILLGVAPFIPGAVFKLCLLALWTPALRRLFS